MACKYLYEGKWITEEQFKKVLSEGYLDTLLKDGKLNIPELEAVAKETKKSNVNKVPITLRIRHKIQRFINNQRTQGENQFPNKNPLSVIKESIAQGGKPFDFKIVIRVGNELRTGDNKTNLALKAELEASPVNIKDNLKEGIPYMLVPSAYGLYPVQLKSHKISDTTHNNLINTQLIKLFNAENPSDAYAARKAIEKVLYRTTIEMKDGKFYVTKFDTKLNKAIPHTFSTVEEANSFLAKQLFRIDYTKINKGDYNRMIADSGAVSTDLFSENGNFFNSSSFVLEAYQMSENEKEALGVVFDFVAPLKGKESTQESQISNTLPVNNSASKSEESPVFGATLEEINAARENTIVRDIKLPSNANSNYPVTRVTAKVIDGKLTVTSIQHINTQYRKNASPTFNVSPKTPTSTEKSQATNLFFKDKDVVKFKEKLSKEEKVVVEKVEGPKNEGIIAKTARFAALVSEEIEEEVGEPTQDLSDLLAQANEVVSEDPTTVAPTEEINYSDIFDSLDFSDLEDEGDINTDEEAPNVKLRSTNKIDATTWNQKEELEWLSDKIGLAYDRRSGKQGTVRVFRTLESLRHYLPQETYEQLLEARKQGKELHGVFTKAAVLLSKNAAAGTTYHEAFHIVFNLALPLESRLVLIKEAYEKYADELPDKEVVKKDGTIIHRLPTHLEVEELLADKFMEYTQSKEALQLPVTIGKQFKGMYRMLKTFFAPESTINLDNIFEDINLGVYKNRVTFKKTILPGSVKFRQTTAPDLKYDNMIEEGYAFTYLEHLMDKVIGEYKNLNDPESTMNEREIINKIGVHKLYSQMLTSLIKEARVEGSVTTDYKKKLYTILTNRGQNIVQSKIDNTVLFTFSKSSDLLDRFNQNLQKRGLYLTYNTVKTTKQTAKETEEGNTFDDYENEEDTFEESWMKGHIEINPMESVSQRLKSFFATIPKYKTSRKNSVKVINVFGVVEKENPGAIFKFLVTKIANSYSMSDMMTKLQELEKTKPYIRHILEKLEQDSILKTELWASVGSKNFATFSYVYETDGEYVVANSNRKDLNNIIQEELIANFLQADNKLLKADLETIDVDRAKSFTTAMKAAQKWFTENKNSKTGVPVTKEEVVLAFKKTASVLKDYGFNITADDLESVWNPTVGTASWNNILGVFDTLVKIGTELEKGNNVFTSMKPSEIVTKEVRQQGKSIVERLALQLKPALEREVVSSFRNIDGKTAYNLILSGFLDKQLGKLNNPEKFKEYLKEIQGDDLIKNLPIIADLMDEDSDFQEEFSSVLLDGLSRKGKKKAVTYADLSDPEMEAVSIAMFHKGSSRDNTTAMYKLPIPSDSPTIAFIKAKKYSREEIIDRLVKTAEAEFSRIKLLQQADKDSPFLRIPNYFKQGTKFQILSFLNGKVNTKKGFDEKAVRAVIEDYFNKDISKSKFFTKEIEEMKKKGVIQAVNKETGVITFSDKLIDKRIEAKDRTEFYKTYLMNTYYMNTQMTTLFGGDPAFYKNTVDYQKRFKQVMSPGTFTNTENQSATYTGIILNDEELPTTKQTQDHILELIDKSNMTDAEKQQLRVLWTTTDHNTSDAATYISPKRRKQTLEGLGRWTPQHEESLKRIEAGIESIEDLELLNPPFKPEKPFVFSHRIVDGKVVPTQVKNAETVLTKSFAYKKDAKGDYMYPVLAAIYKDMEDGKFDMAIFESAVKAGGIGNSVDAKGKVRFTDYQKQEDGSYLLPENAEIISFKSEDWRLQQETPPHYVDERGNFGTQLRNLIIGDMDLEGDYTIGGSTLKGSEVAKLYQDLVVEDLRSSFEEVREVFEKVSSVDEKGNKTYTIDYERLAAELRKEVLDREMGQDFLDALAPIEVVLKNGETATRTALPLYHPLISYKMEAVMNSFFKNRVTKQKINGGALVNTTSFSVSDQLQMTVDPKTGAITYEAMLPATSKKFFPKDSNGEVDLAMLEKVAPELLRIIGYRIPTEDKYSMFNIKIVGFTPIAMGGVVILPREATTMAGLDFDVDKLYFMTRAFTTNKKGEPKVTKYYDNLKDPKEAQEAATELYKDFRDYVRFIKRVVKKPEDQERMIARRQELSEQLADVYETKKDIENSTEFLELKTSIKDLKEQLKVAKKINSDAVTIKFIEDSITEAYKILEDDFLPFNESLVALREKDQEIINFITKRLQSDTADVVGLNSKHARDNKKLDIIQGILENVNTASSILNPGNFEALKEAAARIRLLQAGKSVKGLTAEELKKKSDELDNEDFNINLPSTQLELFRRNMTGKQLIGAFANHNTHHAKSQYTNLSLKSPIVFNGTNYMELNKIFNPQGQRISKLLATSLAAVVDNAKDPLASFLNMNTFTVNSIALLQRVGVDERTIFAFMNQPVLVELTQRYFNDRGSMSDEKHFQEIKKKWKEKLKDKADNQKVDLTTELLEKCLKPDGSDEYYEAQLTVMEAFERIHKIGAELAQGIQAAKVDTTGVGPSSASNYVLLQKQRRVLEKVRKNKNDIVGLEEIFMGGAEQTMIPGFTQYGLLNPIGILNKIFPSIGNFNNKGTLEFSTLGTLKNYFASQKSSGVLNEKEAQLVNTHYINFVASNFPFFNYKQSKDILTTAPNKLLALKRSLPDNHPCKLFLDNLYVVEADSNSPIRRIEFYNTGKNPIDTQRIKYAWERMMQDSDPNIKQLALDLVKYTYFASGYGFGPYSFANLVPVKFWTDEFQIKERIVDSKGLPFNKFLENNLVSDVLKNEESPLTKRFINQFIRNNVSRESFVNSVKIDKVLTQKELGDSAESANSVTTLRAQKESGGIIQTPKGYLIINASKNPQLRQVNSDLPIKYIKVYGKGNTILLFEHIPTKFDDKNPEEFEGKSYIQTYTYKPVSLLGTSNFTMEYNYSDDIKDSLLSTIKNTPNPSVKTLSPANQMSVEMQIEAEAIRKILPETPTTSTPTQTTQPSTQQQVPKKATRNLGLDLEAGAREEGLGIMDIISYKDYVDNGGTMSQKDFLSLPEEVQNEIIEQQKNC